MAYPPRNLPGSSEVWGREVENRLTAALRAVENSATSFSNVGRASEGQLSVSAGNIDELAARSMEVITLSDMSVSGSATADPFPRTSSTATFSANPKSRTAFLFFQAFTTVSVVPAAPIVVFLRHGSTRLARLREVIPNGVAMNPNESATYGLINGFCRVTVPGGSPFPVTVELVRGSQSTPSTVSLISPQIVLDRSGPSL